MNTYRIYLFIILHSLFSLTVMSQETKTIKVGNNLNRDSLRQAWLLEREVEAKFRRDYYLDFLANTDKDTLTKINLKGLYLHKIPDLSRFDRIKEINGSSNRLTKIRKREFPIDSLRKLSFSNNDLTSFQIPKANQLAILYLDGNKLKKIPRSIKKAHQLKFLNLERNQISRIPRFLLRMDSLKELNLNNNQIKLKRSAARRLAKINTVLLAGNQITELPKNIGDMTGVKKLNFSNNKINCLPVSFKDLNQLTNIIFYKNEFEDIPDEIFHLTQLVELDFYYNKIKIVPEAVGNLTQLKQLFLSFNEISVLPDTIRSLQNLRYLFVHHNAIGILPDWIIQLEKLERLDISYNKLFVLPDLSGMPALTEIDIQENQIEYFPWPLLEKSNLHILVVKNNPFILNSEEKRLLQNWKKDLGSGELLLVY